MASLCAEEEQAASRIVVASGRFVPAVWQTPAYGAAVVEHLRKLHGAMGGEPPLTEDGSQQSLALRQARGARLRERLAAGECAFVACIGRAAFSETLTELLPNPRDRYTQLHTILRRAQEPGNTLFLYDTQLHDTSVIVEHWMPGDHKPQRWVETTIGDRIFGPDNEGVCAGIASWIIQAGAEGNQYVLTHEASVDYMHQQVAAARRELGVD
ncbi:MAG TPA: Scr1 family TA system antitoxin-like transcriptional regulator [Candidatus Saccharimonadales bacterium]|nr:Scr1 family TA system antitoxin-like transcriptional regulator [Candidatus Saccharimonadales bacterium]